HTIYYTLTLFPLFFFKRCGVHRDLHSFPTRRSSDLTRRRILPPLPSVKTYSAPSGPSLTPRMRALSSVRSRCSATTRSPSITSRSEEHTSELQSLAYLVCRLLLEKKKQHSSSPSTTN